MSRIGLVLEGGGMRGAYTAGILDSFIEEDIEFNYVIGVSAGANNGINYVTKQKERSKRIFLHWSQDRRFLSFTNLFKERSYFGMDFIFNKLPNELEKFDYEAFEQSPVTFMACASNCDTGEARYFDRESFSPKQYMDQALRASSSLPIISPSVKVSDFRYLDGVMTDPIPISKSINDGNEFNVVILTKQQEKCQKLSFMDRCLVNLTKKLYPNLKESIDKSTKIYNDSLSMVSELNDEGKVFLFKPKRELLENRYVKDSARLEEVYSNGYIDGKSRIEELKTWINQIN